jgi:DNA-binding transcriptional regulator GbsR (MarR family)
MPGGRLAIDERRRIATWLGEGLGYAEIARRLARPTSTISREVARNGGPQAYQADRAHQDTARRARRNTPQLPPGAPSEANDNERDFDAVRDFEQQFSAIMIQTGLPPMPARVLACLFTSDTGSLTAAALVQRLQVSPASVSKAIGYLEKLEMVRRERDNQRRRERYLMHDDVWYRAWLHSARSTTMWADAAQRGAEILGVATPAGARLHRTSHYLQLIIDDMAKLVERRRPTLQTPPTPAET